MRIEETLKTTNHSGANGFQVFIMTTDGNDFPVNGVHANTTVSQLKELIKKKIGDRFRVEKLVFGSHVLEDGRTMASYNITTGKTVHLVTDFVPAQMLSR